VVSIANAGPAPCRAGLVLAGSPSAVIDAVDGTRLPLEPAGGAERSHHLHGERAVAADLPCGGMGIRRPAGIAEAQVDVAADLVGD
jgi:hypothetical protein